MGVDGKSEGATTVPFSSDAQLGALKRLDAVVAQGEGVAALATRLAENDLAIRVIAEERRVCLGEIEARVCVIVDAALRGAGVYIEKFDVRLEEGVVRFSVSMADPESGFDREGVSTILTGVGCEAVSVDNVQGVFALNFDVLDRGPQEGGQVSVQAIQDGVVDPAREIAGLE